MRNHEPLVILMSTSRLVPKTNPYATLLTESLNRLPGLRAEPFSWKLGLTGHFDVLHLHWPESRLRGRTPLRSLVRQLLFILVVVRSRTLRRPIVRTVHNVELPQGLSRRERWILLLVERFTTLRIRLNEATPVRDGQPVVTIKHGHYRDWFAKYPRSQSIPGRFAFFGLIRRYKAVGELTRAFTETAPMDDQVSLHISGHPSSPNLAAELQAAAVADPRISLCLRRIDDAEIVREVGEAEVIVLPYPEMHNSGAVLTALSLDRPVLVPDNLINRALAEEVGPGWVHCFSSPLTGMQLLEALKQSQSRHRQAPRFIEREWDNTAAAHVTAYGRALGLVGRGSTP